MRALLLALLLVAPAARAEDTRQTALHARLVVKVVHPDEVRRDVLADVAKLDGFPVLVTEGQLVLKVPPDQLGAALEALSDRGVVIEKTMERNDLTLAIAQLEAQLRSKQEIFGRLRQVLDDSDVNATLQIERDMAQLVMEMESLEGQLRVQRERAAWALIDASFNFRQRDRLVYVSSPFAWINSVDLSRFLAEF